MILSISTVFSPTNFHWVCHFLLKPHYCRFWISCGICSNCQKDLSDLLCHPSTHILSPLSRDTETGSTWRIKHLVSPFHVLCARIFPAWTKGVFMYGGVHHKADAARPRLGKTSTEWWIFRQFSNKCRWPPLIASTVWRKQYMCSLKVLLIIVTLQLQVLVLGLLLVAVLEKQSFE